MLTSPSKVGSQKSRYADRNHKVRDVDIRGTFSDVESVTDVTEGRHKVAAVSLELVVVGFQSQLTAWVDFKPDHHACPLTESP